MIFNGSNILQRARMAAVARAFWVTHFHTSTVWLCALRALAWVISPLSCGIVQQGIGTGGSAGAKKAVVFEVPPCHSKKNN